MDVFGLGSHPAASLEVALSVVFEHRKHLCTQPCDLSGVWHRPLPIALESPTKRHDGSHEQSETDGPTRTA